jgi:hypothetical protein
VQDGCNIGFCRSSIGTLGIDGFVTVLSDLVGNAEEAQFFIDGVTSPIILTRMLKLKMKWLMFVDV